MKSKNEVLAYLGCWVWLTLAIRVMSCTSFSYVLLRLSIVLHDGLAAPILNGTEK